MTDDLNVRIFRGTICRYQGELVYVAEIAGVNTNCQVLPVGQRGEWFPESKKVVIRDLSVAEKQWDIGRGELQPEENEIYLWSPTVANYQPVPDEKMPKPPVRVRTKTVGPSDQQF